MILVAIVTYNGLKWIDYLLQPFVVDRAGLEIAIVDNASTDGTPQAIEERYPFVRVVCRSTNLGFGAANNLLIEEAIAREYQGVYLLNQDAQIQASAIRALAEYSLSHPSIGILSPTHLSASGEIERGFSHYLPSGYGSDFTEVPFINAAHWYLPRHTLRSVGGFSPLFYHYGEDLDYAHRVRAKGYTVGFLPQVTAFHYRSDEALTTTKSLWLKQAYHLGQLVSPLHSHWQQLYRGFITPLGESIFHEEVRPMVRALWHRREEISLWNHRPALDIDGLKRAVKRKSHAPVLLFVYNRPEHTECILKHLYAQPEAEQTPIYIWSDGAKGASDASKVAEVRRVCHAYPVVQVYEQSTNVGLANNVIAGVSTVLRTHDRVIVVEDDLILSPYFLRWMNDALEKYAHAPQVAHLHAGTFYTSRGLQHNHPLRLVGSWGWATWRDCWQELWEPDGKKLLAQLEARPEERKLFDYCGFMKFTRMLRQQTEEKNSSWAVRWHASLFLNGKISINANPPLVANGGFDGTGTHSGGGGRYRTAVSPFPLYAEGQVPTTESAKARSILQHYYIRTNNKVMKGWYKLRELLGR